MRVDLFDFELPAERIALRPSEPRDAARLLLIGEGSPFSERIVRDLPDLLRPGDVVVLNNTKVIPAQLEGERIRADGARASVSLTLHKRLSGSHWRAFAKGARRLRADDRVVFAHPDRDGATLGARIVARDGMEVDLAFDVEGAALDEAVRAVGHIPLPPYIAARRSEDFRDRSDYQTVFARHDGSVAAPTAGLHMTPDLIERLRGRGIDIQYVTLHVGAGTFLPVKSDTTEEHVMHAEWGEVDADTVAALEAARQKGGRIVAVGTTSLRLLETAARGGRLQPFRGDTAIFITPGYRFQAVDVLLTNFHLPRSTLFMLVSAFRGLDTMRAAYAHAIAAGFRFYSYGDACLIERGAA